MLGGDSDPRLFRADNGEFYVVKYKNNPHRIRGLVNDYVGTRIARELGLPCLPVEIITISEDLIKDNNLFTRHHRQDCQWVETDEYIESGLHFGCLYVENGQNAPGAKILRKVINAEDIPGSVLFDTWIMNADREFDRNIFVRTYGSGRSAQYEYVMIDHDYCFTGNDWNESIAGDSNHMSNVYGRHNWLAFALDRPDGFEKWFDAIRSISESQLTDICNEVPNEWDFPPEHKTALVEFLVRRRRILRKCLARHFGVFVLRN